MIAYTLYLIFVFSYFLHLPSRFPFLGHIRFDFLLMISIVICLLPRAHASHSADISEPATRRLALLIAFIVISTPFVEWPGSAVRSGFAGFAKVIPFYFFTVSIIQDEPRLKRFVLAFIISQSIRIIEPLYLHVTTGYWGDLAHAIAGESDIILNRLGGAPRDIINSNQLAWVVVTTIPFIYYLGWQSSRLVRMAVLFLAPVFIYAGLLTGSRSGLLSLVSLLIAMLYLSRRQSRHVILGIILVAAVTVVLISAMAPDLKQRYESLYDWSVPGGGTAIARLEGLTRTFFTVWNRPIVGHGLGTSLEVSANYIPGRAFLAHNLFIEILQELGIAGLILFIAYLAAIVSTLKQAKAYLDSSPSASAWLRRLIIATQAWIAMDLVYSLSSFGLNSWEWYLFGGIATVCLRLARQRASDLTASPDS